MYVIFTHKYFLPIVAFSCGLLIGKYLLTPEQTIHSDDEASSKYEIQQKQQEKRVELNNHKSISTFASHGNALSKIKPQVNQKEYPVSDDAKLSNMFKVSAVRLAALSEDSLYEQANLYWHNQLYLSESIEDKLTAIEELVNLQESHLLASGLGDDNIEVRIATIEGLKKIANNEAVQVLGQALFSEQNTAVKNKIIDALETLDYLDNALIFLNYTKRHSTEK
jgi:HEAT repeats